ncbi:MAG: Gfo/Idh/MocA family protein [Verrucomicrobiales bacterium]
MTNPRSSTTRRSFLKTAAISSAPLILRSGLRGADAPSRKITMGFIGMGKQNAYLMPSFLGHDDKTRVLAVCDVDTTRRTAAKQRADALYKERGQSADTTAHSEWRELIARKDIDAVCIATPDHWHGLITTAALAAGKDVYCEKPLTHTVEESVAIIDGVKKHKRVLQTGSMQRSMKEFRVACELVRNGVIGKISHVECQFGVPSKPCDLPEEPMEPGLDWNAWLGPAPLRPYNSILAPRGNHDHYPLWRLYSEYAAGYVGDWGAHHLDIAHWGLGMDDSGPVEIIAAPAGATEGAVLKYANGITVKHLNGGFGVHFYGDAGEVKVNRGAFELVLKDGPFIKPGEKVSTDGAVARAEKQFLADAKVRLYATPKGDHLRDFLTAVESRQKPCTHEIIGGRTSIICCLMDLSYTHQRSMKWNPANNTFAQGSGNPDWLKGHYRGDLKLT